tara:strand:+ start:425 stop:796 length:372 start_codon:yes stop_codon:yes gene_type:complete
MIKVSAKELLSWVKETSSEGGDENALYLLLDLLGGISKEDLNLLKINSAKEIYLKENLSSINSYWMEFINDKRPIQYICGSTYWRDYKFKVSEDVLIPRGETELIVDIAIDICREKKKFYLQI